MLLFRMHEYEINYINVTVYNFIIKVNRVCNLYFFSEWYTSKKMTQIQSAINTALTNSTFNKDKYKTTNKILQLQVSDKIDMLK